MDLLRVHSRDLHEHIAQEIGECLESGLYTDLAIRCDNGDTLHGHKLVLAAVSPYLQHLLENNEWEEVQTIEMSDVGVKEMNLLLEVVYNGVVEATIEDLRALILLAHRLYINIPISDDLMQGLELTLPRRPPFRPPAVLPKMPMPALKLNLPFKPTPNTMGQPADPKKPKLNLDPNTMTAVLAKSRNSEHVCPICNSKYNNVGNFKQHMKLHDNEALREQRNVILGEMIATCFNRNTSLYTCHVCKSNYNHSGNFKQHLLKHERESGSISATLVAQASSNPHLTNVLKSAMADRVDSGDKPPVIRYQYQCEHCDRSFKHPGNYKQHLASHMRTTQFAPNPSVSNSLQKMNAMFAQQNRPSLVVGNQGDGGGGASVVQMAACPECHLEFPGIDLLQAHISVSHKHLDVSLPSSAGEEDNNSRDDHMASLPLGRWIGNEEPETLYNCQICGKGFLKMAKLTSHMKIHRAPEEHYNHPCDICGKKFTRPQHVARHKMLHTGERPFKCHKCPRQFTREDKLRHHLIGECGGIEGSPFINSPGWGNENDSNDVMNSSQDMYGVDNSNPANGSNMEDEEDEEDGLKMASESNDSNSNLMMSDQSDNILIAE